MEKRICKKCGEEKDIKHFHKARQTYITKSGEKRNYLNIKKICISCRYEIRNEWARKQKEKQTNSYIKHQLHHAVKYANITPEMITLKRNINDIRKAIKEDNK
jgi:hypothetical protein